MTTVNNFIDKISNEQTALLPAIEFRGEIRLVEHERDIAEALELLRRDERNAHLFAAEVSE